ncbi:MAG: hemolysin family protein [Actinomycetota bacterium]
MSEALPLLVTVALLLANAFFVGAEFALISARRTMVEPRAAAGSHAARITLGAMEHVSLMMAGAQLGITICSLGLGAVGEPAVAHLLEGLFESVGIPDWLVDPAALAIALSGIVFLHVVVGEMVPKNLALAGPERSALLFAPPLVFLVRGLRPVIAALNAVANATLRLARVEPQDEVTSTFTRDEVAGLVRESRREGLLDEDSYELVSGALRFDERDVRSVLPPLDSLVTVPTDVTPDEVERIAARTGYSRFPVRDRPGGDGELSGYLHLKDALVETDALARRRPIPPEWIRALPTVGADDKLRAAAATMQRGGAHLVLAREADGTIAGIATLEDVLEALVGEIRDEAQRHRQR